MNLTTHNSSAIRKRISPIAGKTAPLSLLINVGKLVTAYCPEVPEPSVQKERVTFGIDTHLRQILDEAQHIIDAALANA